MTKVVSEVITTMESEDFVRITPLCRSGRRALWVRFSQQLPTANAYDPDGKKIELRAGREGRDEELVLQAGQTLTEKDIVTLVDIFLATKFSFEQ